MDGRNTDLVFLVGVIAIGSVAGSQAERHNDRKHDSKNLLHFLLLLV